MFILDNMIIKRPQSVIDLMQEELSKAEFQTCQAAIERDGEDDEHDENRRHDNSAT